MHPGERRFKPKIFAPIMTDHVTQLIDQLAQLKRERRAADDRLRNLIAHNIDGVLIVDLNGRVRFANPAAERLLARAADALIDHPFGYPVLVGESTEIDILRSGDAVHVAELRAASTDWEGQSAFIISLRDVTERKRIERALRDSQLRLALVLDATSEGVWDWNVVTGVVYYSPRWLETLGYRSDDMRPTIAFREGLIHPDDLPRVREQLQQHLLGRTPHHSCEYRVRARDGTWRWMLERGKVVEWDEVGQPTRVVGANTDISERKQAEAALQSSEERYRTLVDNLPIGVYRTTPGPRGRFLVANPALARILGYESFEQLQQIDVAQVYATPAERQRFSDLVLQMGSVVNFELRLSRRDGTLLWAAVTARVVRGPDGEAAYFDCTLTDVTQRKLAEDAEREQRALAEALRDTAAVLSSTLNVDEVFDRILDNIGRIVPNDLAAILLVDEAREVAYSVRVRSQPDLPVHLQRYELPLRRAPNVWHMYQTGQPQAIPDTLAHPGWLWTAEFNWVRSNVGAPVKVRGQVVGFLNLYSANPDFFTLAQAARLQAFADQAAVAIQNAQLYEQVQLYAGELENRVAQRTAELEQERRRLQAILDAAGESIVFTDPAGVIEYANPALEQLTGYTAAEMRGQTPRLWSSDRTPRAVHTQLWTTILNGGIWRGEVVNRRKDGRVYDAALIVSPLADANGSLVGFVGLQRDISRQKEIDRLKDQFVANVSHELRTPLTNVKLYLGLLERGRPEKRDQYLQTLQRETMRLEALIENLLHISQLDLGQVAIDLVPVDLNQLVAQMVFDRGALIAGRGLTLDARPEPNLPPALANDALVAQVLSNLITNAMHYTAPGGTITLSTALLTDEGQKWVTITVTDTGPGIVEHDLPHLFERFYRGEAGRRSGMPGTGLGLAICAEIMARLAGRITVDSRPGHGATFTVWLPPAR